MSIDPPTLTEALETLLLGLRPVSPERATELLRGVRGRNGYVPGLQKWLDASRSAFPEPFAVEDLDGLQDHGIDILLQGASSRIRIGFQVKSDRDLRAQKFSRDLKAQILEAQSYGIERIVVIFACPPTEQNLAKIKYWQGFTGRNPQMGVLCLGPQRAAGLYEQFEHPVERIDLPERSWVEFFRAAGQLHLASSYLDPWPGLPPDRRFLAPEVLPAIRRSLAEHQLTILVGPPAAGKTFVALQLLWDRFRAGRPVRWLTTAGDEATEGPIPAGDLGRRAIVEFKRRVDALHRSLGSLYDELDFVSRLLLPDALVYIEDPFGKTEEEYAQSFASYDYFDLQRMIEMLESSSRRAGCRILLTSREPIFRRWLADLESRGRLGLKASVIVLPANSYPPGPLYKHLLLLAEARGLSEPEMVAEVLADGIELPFEADTLIRDLEPGEGAESARQALAGWEGELRDKIAGRLTPRDEREALFLLLVDAFASSTGPDYPAETYRSLHKVLQLPGDPGAAYARALRRLGPFLVPQGSDEIDSQVYVPSHSIVLEAIRDQLAAPERSPLLCRTAKALPSMKRKEPSRGVFGSLIQYASKRGALGRIALSLLGLGIADAGEQERAALGEILFTKGGLEGREYRLMDFWPALPEEFQERFFTALHPTKSRSSWRLELAVAHLLDSRMDERSAWRLLGLLLAGTRRGAGRIDPFTSPWRYLFLHLDTAPDDLLSKLDDWAREDPAAFVDALGDALLLFWDRLSGRFAIWRRCFFDPKFQKKTRAQAELIQTVARHWDRAPQALREIFDFHSRSSKASLRSEIGNQALFYAGRHPDLEPFALATLSDPERSIPLSAFGWGQGDDAHRRFAESLLESASAGLAADMALALLEDHDEEFPLWQRDVIARCQRLSEDATRAAITFAFFEGEERAKLLDYQPAGSPFEEPEIVRAAWLWAHLNSLRSRPTLSDEDLLRMLRSFEDRQIRGWCLFYVSYQLTALPECVHRLLDELSGSSPEDAEAIAAGAKDRQPESSRTVLRFLISKMVQ